MNALALGLVGLGATLAGGRAVAATVEGLARNPSAPGLRNTMVLGLGMIESLLVLTYVFLLR